MKRLLAILTEFLFFLSATAAPVMVQALIIDCHSVQTCAVYVDDSAVSGGDGTSAKPFKAITQAVNYLNDPANMDYSTILIAEGTYTNGVAGETMPWAFSTNFGRTINIYGGYYNSFAASDSETHPTNVDAKGAVNIFNLTSIGGNIKGLNLFGTGTNFANAVNIQNTGWTSLNITVANNIFHDNKGVTSIPGLSIKVTGSNTANVQDNFFYANSASNGNVVQAQGTVTLHNNQIYNNNASKIIYCSGGAKVYNNFVVLNTANFGVHAAGNCQFAHNTVDRSTINAASGNAVVLTANNGNDIVDNIISNSKNEPTLVRSSGDNSTFDYNALFGNNSDPATVANLTFNNTTCDPLLAVVNIFQPSELKMGTGSACIDTGKNLSNVTEDFWLTPRPLDGNGDGVAVSDPGAYEVPALIVVAPVISNLAANPATFSPNGDNINDTATISFDLNSDASVKVVVQNQSGAGILNLINEQYEKKGTVTVTWDGKDQGGTVVADGSYIIAVTALNSAGTATQQITVTVTTAGGGQCAGFPDVSANDPLCPAITYVKQQGIFSGYPDGTFQPNTIINRVETTKVTLLGFKKTILAADGTKDGFSDVDPAAWYMPYVRTAKTLGVLQGYPDGTLKPAQQIIRVEMLKVFFVTSGKDLSGVVVNAAPYKDTPIDASTAWYIKFVQYSKDHNLVDASADGYFYPALGMKRGDVAQLFYRYHQAGLDQPV